MTIAATAIRNRSVGRRDKTGCFGEVVIAVVDVMAEDLLASVVDGRFILRNDLNSANEGLGVWSFAKRAATPTSLARKLSG